MTIIISAIFILSMFSVILYNDTKIEEEKYNNFKFVNTGTGLWKMSLVKGTSITFLHSPSDIINFTEDKNISENFAKSIWDKKDINIGFTDDSINIDYNQEFVNYLSMLGYTINLGCYIENCSIGKILDNESIDFVFDLNDNSSFYENLNTGYLFNMNSYTDYVFFMEKIMLDFLE